MTREELMIRTAKILEEESPFSFEYSVDKWSTPEIKVSLPKTLKLYHSFPQVKIKAFYNSSANAVLDKAIQVIVYQGIKEILEGFYETPQEAADDIEKALNIKYDYIIKRLEELDYTVSSELVEMLTKLGYKVYNYGLNQPNFYIVSNKDTYIFEISDNGKEVFLTILWKQGKENHQVYRDIIRESADLQGVVNFVKKEIPR